MNLDGEAINHLIASERERRTTLRSKIWLSLGKQSGHVCVGANSRQNLCTSKHFCLAWTLPDSQRVPTKCYRRSSCGLNLSLFFYLLFQLEAARGRRFCGDKWAWICIFTHPKRLISKLGCALCKFCLVEHSNCTCPGLLYYRSTTNPLNNASPHKKTRATNRHLKFACDQDANECHLRCKKAINSSIADVCEFWPTARKVQTSTINSRTFWTNTHFNSVNGGRNIRE